MPRTQLKKLAKKHGVSPGTAERYWRECKASVKAGTRNRYARVMGCVTRRMAHKK